MLVKDLIEKLKNVPENYEVIMESGMHSVDFDITELTEFNEVVLVPLG